MKKMLCHIVMLNPKWVGKVDNGKDCVLDEAIVYITFGEKFANELKFGNRGFIDVSRLHEN